MSGADSVTVDDLLLVISAALKAGDWRGVDAALHVLAVKSPRDAEAILAVIKLAASQ